VSRTSSTSSNHFLEYREDIQTIVEATDHSTLDPG
jgi:hypothetical protein